MTRPVDRRAQLRRTPRLTADALKMVWASSRRHFIMTAILQLAMGIGIAIQLLVAGRIMEALVAVSGGEPANSLYLPFGLLVGVMGVLGTVGALVAYQQRLLVDLVGRHAFGQIIGVAATVDYQSFENSEFYDQLQRARNSGQFRAVDMVNSIISLITALVTTVGIAVVLVIIHPALLGFLVLAAVPGLLASIHNSRKSYAFEYAMTAESRERAYVVELLTERSAAKEVRLFALADHLRRRYDVLTLERLRRLRAFLRQRLRVSLVAAFAGAAGTGLALGALVFLLSEEQIGVAAALTAGIAMQQLGTRLSAITGNLSRLVESGMFIDDYRGFVDLLPDGDASSLQPNGSPETPKPSEFSGIRVEDVSFAYPGTGTLALERVSLEVRPGEIVALVGENGSGKTTLVKLICRLYDPEAGRILWNGKDVTGIDSETIRSEITVLFQDFIRYHLSALDNIRFGRVQRPPNLEDAVAAATQAGADSFLSRLPKMYETRLGREFYGGHELSVGEWQRLALARAFFRGGSFLILDEPTASLDPRGEREVFNEMRRLSAGRSVLLISHRFSSVRSADRIYVLADGRVTEAGTHEDLMALNGHYAELFNLQAAAYHTEADDPKRLRAAFSDRVQARTAEGDLGGAPPSHG